MFSHELKWRVDGKRLNNEQRSILTIILNDASYLRGGAKCGDTSKGKKTELVFYELKKKKTQLARNERNKKELQHNHLP